MANKVVVDIASKLLVTLAAGAGALLAKSATQKGLGEVIKRIGESKSEVKEAVESATETMTETLPDAAESMAEAVEKVAEVAEEASGA